MEKKIDRRRNYYVVLDTETCPIDKSMQKVDAMNMWCYDLGFAIVDKWGNVYETRSFIIKEIFFNERNLMLSAYYANKIPMYEEEIRQGSRKVVTFYQAREELKNLMEEYETNIVICHNARFDDVCLKQTERWLTKSKYRYFLPYGTEVWDSLKMVNDTIVKQKSYITWCEKHGYMTNHKTPRPQTKAEVLYKYFSGNDDFVESHTGLEDVLIEKDIFAWCMRQHKPMRKALYQ